MGTGTQNSGSGLPPPKILLAKPVSSRTESPSNPRSRLPSPSPPPPPASLNLLSPDSLDFHIDRILPFLSENTDYTVIGVIGTAGSGKSTIMNELYDVSSLGSLPPFATQSEEIKAMAKHCTAGIDLRISTHHRLILLDTQPLFSPSVLAEMTRPDGSSTLSLINGENLSADLAHELIGIQLGVFLASVCHVLLVVTEGIHNTDMWHLMLTADLLKHGIPDPSLSNSSHSQGSNLATEKDMNFLLQRNTDDHLASPVFVHTKLQDHEVAPHKLMRLKKTLAQYFSSSSFMRAKNGKPDNMIDDLDSRGPSVALLPYKNQDDAQGAQYESFTTMLGKLRDQVLSMNYHRFAKSVSEREWLRNSARIWENAKKSPVFVEYIRTLQSSGMFRS